MAVAEVGFVSLSDLAADARATLLADFVAEVYEPSFPRREHREDPAVWARLLSEPEPSPAPLLAIVLALDGDAVVGGVVFEYYRRANAALVTYVAVAPGLRRQGIARGLLADAVARLRALADADGRPPPPILAEVEDPGALADGRDAARDRLRALSSLGVLACDLPYRQPPLRPGEPPAGGLLLCALDVSLDDRRALPATRVAAFLREFYASLPTGGADAKAALREMLDWLRRHDPVAFHDAVRHA